MNGILYNFNNEWMYDLFIHFILVVIIIMWIKKKVNEK